MRLTIPLDRCGAFLRAAEVGDTVVRTSADFKVLSTYTVVEVLDTGIVVEEEEIDSN
jgi:hypothetical protein